MREIGRLRLECEDCTNYNLANDVIRSEGRRGEELQKNATAFYRHRGSIFGFVAHICVVNIDGACPNRI